MEKQNGYHCTNIELQIQLLLNWEFPGLNFPKKIPTFETKISIQINIYIIITLNLLIVYEFIV